MDNLGKAISDLESIVGKRVSTRLVDRIIYAGDVWTYHLVKAKNLNEIQLPDVIVWPKNANELKEIINIARKYKISVVPYSGGAGVIGGTIPMGNPTITVDLKQMSNVLELDEVSMTVNVEAGILSQHLEDYLNRRGYMFPHYPMSMWTSTIGGFLATRASGIMSTKYGNMEDLTISFEVVAGNSEIYRFPRVPKASHGPDLKRIFIGSEGTLGIFTKAELRIYHLPEERCFLVYSFSELSDGVEALRRIIQKGIRPAMIRLYDELDTFATFARKGIEVEGNILIIMLDESPAINDALEEEIKRVITSMHGEKLDSDIGYKWWENRFHKYFATPDAMKMGLTDTLETVVKWKNVLTLYEEMKEAFEDNEIALMAHLSHFYQDSAVIYFTFIAEYGEDDPFENYRNAWKLGAEICLKHGASISHHHGIGVLKSPWVRGELKEAYSIFRKLKEVFDPDNILNPGKLGLNEVKW